jgi:recombination protein RecR
MPASDLIEFGKQLSELKEKTKKCSVCMNLSEKEICTLCSDLRRDSSTITVIESPLDLLSFEKGNIYKGLYHVLHGRIDPLNNIGPDDIYINPLLERVKQKGNVIKEIILATNPDMEGEATAMYIKKRLDEIKVSLSADFSITRLAYGLPMGASVEYADYGTLGKAIENRRSF